MSLRKKRPSDVCQVALGRILAPESQALLQPRRERGVPGRKTSSEVPTKFVLSSFQVGATSGAGQILPSERERGLEDSQMQSKAWTGRCGTCLCLGRAGLCCRVWWWRSAFRQQSPALQPSQPVPTQRVITMIMIMSIIFIMIIVMILIIVIIIVTSSGQGPSAAGRCGHSRRLWALSRML